MSKRICCVILTLCLLMGMSPPWVRAAVVASGTCGDNVTWTLDDAGTLTISGSGNMADYSYNTIPWYDFRSNITTVVIENGVTSIGAHAFHFCEEMTSVTIPNSVISIGECAFEGCGLASVTIPNSVTSIGTHAFEDCSGLTSVAIPNSVTSIGTCAFEDCSGLTSVTISNSVTEISEAVFTGCTSLANVTIPSSITSIGNSAFDGCSSLTSVIIPNSVTFIGEAAFAGTGLTSVTIPNSVTEIDGRAFASCQNLVSINVESGNTAYTSENGILFNKDKNALICYPAGKVETTYVIPNSVTFIGESAFWECEKLTNVTIPDSVTEIGSYVFFGCSTLTSVTIPDSVIRIGSGVFSGCSSLTSMIIPNSVTSIPSSAFYNCSKLTNVTIPNSVTSIGAFSFHGCSNLANITIPNGITFIGQSAFYNCSKLTNVTIPNSVTSLDNSAFRHCENLIALNVESMNALYSSENGVLFNADKSHLISYPAGKNESVYYIPNSVVEIASYAFYGCKNLVSVVIPNGVTEIENWTFDDCINLSSVTIPSSITFISGLSAKSTASTAGGGGASSVISAFRGCSNLKEIYYESTQTQWNSISTASSSANKIANKINVDVHCIDGTLTASIPISSGGGGSSSSGSGGSGGNSSDSRDSSGGGSSGGQQAPVTNNDPAPEPDNETYYVEFDENGGSGQMNAVTVRGNTYTLPENGFLPPYGMRFRAWRVDYERGDTFEYFPNMTIPITSDATVTALWEKDTAALAQGYCGAEGDGTNLMWSLSRDWNLTISGAGDMASYDTDNRAPWYGYHTNIQSATLQSGVTKVGSHAFTYCAALEEVTLPETLVTIEEGAFLNCAALESVNLPSGLVILGNRAFAGCEKLRNVTIPANVTDIGDYAFEDCAALESAQLPSGLARIGYYAFRNCESLRRITIPQNVSVLNIGAFSGCTSLREVTFPDALARIDANVFDNCRALRYESRRVSYPGTVERFGAIALTLGENNDPLKADVVHCADGDYDWTPPDPYRILDALQDMDDFQDQTWRLAGPFFDFQELRIGDADGNFGILEPTNALTRTGLDYLAEEGSTKLTIPAETFRNFGYGSHKIAADFRNAANTETGGVETRDQIYTVFPPNIRIDSTELYGVNGVEKVSYSGRFRTEPVLEDGLYRFRVISGQTPPGLTLRDGGYFAGAAQTAGTYIFTVGLQLFRNGAWSSEYKDTVQAIIVIEQGTLENVAKASDPGYEIIVPAQDQVVETEMDPEKFELISRGPFEEFRDLYIDGVLIPRENYKARPYDLDNLVNNRPIVLDQGQQTGTYISDVQARVETGSHTVALDFEKEDGFGNKKIQKSTQALNIKKATSGATYTGGGSSGGGSSSGSGSSSSSGGYAISKEKTKNGSFSLDKSNARSGSKVTITPKPNKGYQTGAVKVTDSAGNAVKVSASGGKYTFTMPSRRVKVSVTFTSSTAAPTRQTHRVSVEPSPNGAVTLSAPSAVVGDTVTLSAAPDKGYLLMSVEARDSKGAAIKKNPISDNSYSFTMPSGGVTVKANFEPKHLGTFKDILGPYWFFDDAEWAYNRGILRGVTDEYWEPESKISGPMSIVTLERLDGVDLTPYDTGALDGLDNSKWYVSALRWARNNGICNSYRAFTDEPLTRGEYAVILCNFLRYRGLSTASDNEVHYTDAAALTNKEREAFQFLDYAGVFKGYEDGAIRPGATLNRAQLASLLHRLSQYIIRAESL